MQDEGKIINNVKIFENVFGGNGVARLDDGEIVFIPFTAPGDIATIEITETKKSFCKAAVRKLETASPLREKPICPYFGRCGGCAYQHLSFEAECNAKKSQFKTLMQRLGKFQNFPELETFACSEKRYGYRNKLRLEPFADGNRISYGFCQVDNVTFFPITQCPLAMDNINNALRNEIINAQNYKYRKKQNPYTLTLRTDSTGNTVSYLGKASAKLKWLHEKLLGNEVSVPVGSFWQVNPDTADMLFATLKDWLKTSNTRSLIDAYAGVGTFSLAMHDLFQYRVIIESDEQAIAASRFNHQQYNLKARFIASTTENALGQSLANVKTSDTTVILDPPRTGCMTSVIKDLLDFHPVLIAYVSCNPATLARDLHLLCENGTYTPIRAAAFNMFPNTAHFESAVLLQYTK